MLRTRSTVAKGLIRHQKKAMYKHRIHAWLIFRCAVVNPMIGFLDMDSNFTLFFGVPGLSVSAAHENMENGIGRDEAPCASLIPSSMVKHRPLVIRRATRKIGLKRLVRWLRGIERNGGINGFLGAYLIARLIL